MRHAMNQHNWPSLPQLQLNCHQSGWPKLTRGRKAGRGETSASVLGGAACTTHWSSFVLLDCLCWLIVGAGRPGATSTRCYGSVKNFNCTEMVDWWIPWTRLPLSTHAT